MKPKPRIAARKRPSRLSIPQILAWADAYHAKHGRWPTQRSGKIRHGLTWANLNQALFAGHRGLPGGSSLATLLAEKRGVRISHASWKLTRNQVLAWADEHYAKHGRWPSPSSGAIGQSPGLTWRIVEQALRLGRHGLPSGASLARLLADERGATGARKVHRLTVAQILAWADGYHACHGLWPTRRSGPVAGVSGLSWEAIDQALRLGRHGLTAGTSLAQLLICERGVQRRKSGQPPLDVPSILVWADAYYLRHGRWPTHDSGAVDGMAGETWNGVATALMFGLRGLPAGSSLVELLADKRGAPAGPSSVAPTTQGRNERRRKPRASGP
jgi:hypothetical protein